MEEDIKRCRELIKPEHSNWIGITNQTALKNLIKGYRELEERNKILNESQEIKIKKIQELEVENIGLKRTINDLDNEKLTEKLCGFNQCNEYWKSKIKKKIEELKEKNSKEPKGTMRDYLDNEVIKILQELLEEE